MPVSIGQLNKSNKHASARVHSRSGFSLIRTALIYVAAAFCLLTFSGLSHYATANAANRSLKLYYVHTKERATITFKKNGRFDKDGLEKLNRFLRDWRRNEPTKMDPRLFDLLWEVYQRTGSNEYINVLSAYRAPATNAMLRSRSKAVAKNSQHILGKAMDFYIPGVPLKKLREIGLKLQIGGVGYYPTSGSPFVHMDVGGVRAWPRASRADLVRLFPDGKTLHIPPDGKPLPGYQAAMADYKRRVGATSIEVADSASSPKSKKKNLFQILFGGGDEDEEPDAISSSETVVASAQPKAAPAPVQQASALPGVEAPVPSIRPAFSATSANALVSPDDETKPDAIQTALLENADAEPEFADLTQYQIPLPQLMGERLLPGDAQTELAAIDPAKLPEPQLRANALQETAPELVADASNDADNNDELAALLTEMGDEEPVADQEATQEMAMLEPPPEPVTLTRSLAGQVGSAEAVATNAQQPEVTSLANSYASLQLTSDQLRASIQEPVTPKKGGRPNQDDASAANRSSRPGELRLTPELLADWAITKQSITLESKAVKAPRYVSRVMRAQPKMVYAAGFTQPEDVDPNRFAGSAVNFMKVRKF